MSAASEVSAVTTTFRVAWIGAGRRGHVWSSTESCTDARGAWVTGGRPDTDVGDASEHPRHRGGNHRCAGGALSAPWKE